ncbi:unnamed protein product [Cylindrotheca closterium]|uniref:Methyltransferase domain-containing protein n=1 Tax=Cylindrotheca closterium TaxID=2856 RepID=A0AAD2CAJ6_9STRA|nr:unnamed protein product [Cylindrotheca closterium]
MRVIFFLLASIIWNQQVPCTLAKDSTPDDYLAMADESLGRGLNEKAIGLYEKGISALGENESLLTVMSLETNMASALSAVGRNEESIKSYRKAILAYKAKIDEIDDPETVSHANDIASTASFYMGMVYQDMSEPQKAVDAYGYTYVLDPKHWASLANLASVLHDQMKLHDDALDAYNKAYEILTQTEYEPTDPPEEANPILSQIQYRIGLCLSHNLDRKCALSDDPDMKPVSCKEMATHAFSLAVQFDDRNESAKHMLATITADATMKRASNEYVKNLFDEYAQNFEHSLVEELGYTGYEKLRRGFDRALGDKIEPFSLVVDAGCGTGLVGEQFRNVSSYLIGVDLSQAILDEAEKMRPGLYDERIAADVMDVFRQRKPISLIVAADSYIYFGDLQPLFEAMVEGLADNGVAAFTLENVDAESEETLTETKPDWRWQLTASGRFAHRKDYVESIATDVGLEVMYNEVMDGFRHEHGKSVRGNMFIVKKVMNEAEL